MWQAILNEQNRVVYTNDWETEVGVPCDPQTQPGSLYIDGEFSAPVYVPEIVTPRQIRLALNQLGLRDTVEYAVSQAPRDIQDTWEYATEINREDPLIQQWSQLLGIDVDYVFQIAKEL